jgi:hypothetical protein
MFGMVLEVLEQLVLGLEGGLAAYAFVLEVAGVELGLLCGAFGALEGGFAEFGGDGPWGCWLGVGYGCGRSWNCGCGEAGFYFRPGGVFVIF